MRVSDVSWEQPSVKSAAIDIAADKKRSGVLDVFLIILKGLDIIEIDWVVSD